LGRKLFKQLDKEMDKNVVKKIGKEIDKKVNKKVAKEVDKKAQKDDNDVHNGVIETVSKLLGRSPDELWHNQCRSQEWGRPCTWPFE